MPTSTISPAFDPKQELRIAALMDAPEWTVGYLEGRYVEVQPSDAGVVIDFVGPHGWGTAAPYCLFCTRKELKWYVLHSPEKMRTARNRVSLRGVFYGPFVSVKDAYVQYDLLAGV